jgi:hypothetical protein
VEADLDGGLDQTRRDKRHRDGHVDVTNAVVCTENLNPDVVVMMKSAKDGV